MTGELKKSDGYVVDLSGREKEREAAGLPPVDNRGIDSSYVVPQTTLPPEEQYSASALGLINGDKGEGDPTQPTPDDLVDLAGDGDGEPSYGGRWDTVPRGPQSWFEQASPGGLDEVAGERTLEFYANRAQANIVFLQDKRFGFNVKFIRKMLFEGTHHALRIISTPDFLSDPVNGINFTDEQLANIRENQIKIEEAITELVDDLKHLNLDIDDFLGIDADNE
jgi:hypothetical protein